MPVQDANTGVHLKELPPVKGKAKDSVGGGVEGNREGEFHGSGPPRQLEMPPIRFGLHIHHGCGKVGPGPAAAEEDVQSEASEWELRERREREEERRQGAEELGAGGEKPLFLPTSSFIASVEEG
jgi:hypothetical protein